MDGPLLMAIDGNSLVHRSYHAQAHTGVPAWAVRGLLGQLVVAVERIRPTAVVVGFDDPQRSDRRERWPQYKAQRTEKLETLVEHSGTALSRHDTMRDVWGIDFGADTSVVDVTISRLRRKLGTRVVVTVRDQGYLFPA